MKKTTWREDLTEEMSAHGETWADVESHTLTESELDARFDHGWGGSGGAAFTLWTKSRVYFPWGYEGTSKVTSVSRHPDGVATPHVGGG